MKRALWVAIGLIIACIALIGIQAQAGNSPFLRTHVHRGDVPTHLLAGGTGRAQVMLHRGLGLASAAVSYVSGTSDFRVPAHTHEESDELLYVLKGGGLLKLGGRSIELSSESAAWIPKGVEHSFVAGPQGIEAVQIYSPGGPEQRFLKAPLVKE